MSHSSRRKAASLRDCPTMSDWLMMYDPGGGRNLPYLSFVRTCFADRIGKTWARVARTCRAGLAKPVPLIDLAHASSFLRRGDPADNSSSHLVTKLAGHRIRTCRRPLCGKPPCKGSGPKRQLPPMSYQAQHRRRTKPRLDRPRRRNSDHLCRQGAAEPKLPLASGEACRYRIRCYPCLFCRVNDLEQ